MPTLHTLENGLTIIAEQLPVPAVNFNIWLNVGSALESDPINGMAHFLEHMIFKGTPTLLQGEFERRIEERGAVTNAATSQDYTHYYTTTAPHDFAHLVNLQLDVVLNPSIPDSAFERERAVVLEEIRRSYDNPRRRTFYRVMEVCFNQLPYRRPVLGSTEVIEALTPQQMRDFHDHWYQPSAITTAVVGDLPAEELIETVTKAFSQVHFPKPIGNKGFSRREHHPEPPFTEIIREEYHDPSLQQARMVMMWRVPGMMELEKTYALDVLAVILGQGKVSRLFRDLREDRALVTEISANNMTQAWQGMFSISVKCPQENLAVVEQAIVDHVVKIQNELVSDSDILRIRKQVANRFIFANERPIDRANLYGYYHTLLNDLNPALKYPQKIQSLTAEDLLESAKIYLNSSAYGIVTALNH